MASTTARSSAAETRSEGANADERVTIDMPQVPLTSPEVDPGMRNLRAMQEAVADAAANVVDSHLLRSMNRDGLPTEIGIDSQTALLQAEAGIAARVKSTIGEALTISAEAARDLAKDAHGRAVSSVQLAECKVEEEAGYLRGDRVDTDGANWSGNIPARRRRTSHSWPMWALIGAVAAAEAAMSYVTWEYSTATKDGVAGVASNVAAVALSALALSGLPHLFARRFARTGRGGVGSRWNLLILLVPLIATALAVMRADYIVSEAKPAEGPNWWLMFGTWVIMFLAPAAFVFIVGLSTYNPHRELYLQALADLRQAQSDERTAFEFLREAEAKLERTQAGRDAIDEIYDVYRDEALPASGEASKDEYRKELTRQLGSPEFTGALASR